MHIPTALAEEVDTVTEILCSTSRTPDSRAMFTETDPALSLTAYSAGEKPTIAGPVQNDARECVN